MNKASSVHSPFLLLGAALVLSISACHKPKGKTSVIVDPPELKIAKIKNVVAKNAALDPSIHEIAQTDWTYSIETKLDFSKKKEKQDKDGFHVWIEITGVRLKLALPITTTVSDKAPKFVLDHENGHVEICRRIYANAREHANKAVAGVIGKQFEGFGADSKLALANALQMAGQEVAAPYRVETAGLAERVSSNYDQLCEKEERRNQVEKTIDDAFAAVEKEDKKP
jgi:hypothetical protein